MRIAQIAPLAESVPPKLYGGTERIVSYLTEELVRQGHDVTLFASGDSVTSAELVPCAEKALRLDPTVIDPLPHHLLMLDEVRRRAADFDLVHFHVDLLHYPMMGEHARHTLTTLHGRLDLKDSHPLYAAFTEFPLVSISDHQRRPMPPVTWAGTVHHGLPLDVLGFSPLNTSGYLAFLGRISPEKRPDRAIRIAEACGLPLKMAAKIDKADAAYWEEVIEPMVRASPRVEFIGEIDEREKARFLGDALALVFPIDWPEPFGLVMIEAMACGTPVLAFGCGSVPEIIEPGVTGAVVHDLDQAVAAMPGLLGLDRARIRETFETRFSATRMADDYVELYRRHARSLDRGATGHRRVAPRLALGV
ncbi:glycosyltransferase family 4 protein [Siculibacillus lacustris]|uniref:Glycosyltransferase family 4 protein n=1 Tax=Siculibacillus lacustris TaxID=1549641 RepID=A0A4Q9VVS1_9HYPH|nr:glycosyltransferase family 4 protein [Siculibacillus lacustris]TBW40359.1 glycosyltransferase family 4 protein [Siculibacillus lacustris]